jgi:hypothetical protein
VSVRLRLEQSRSSGAIAARIDTTRDSPVPEKTCLAHSRLQPRGLTPA